MPLHPSFLLSILSEGALDSHRADYGEQWLASSVPRPVEVDGEEGMKSKGSASGSSSL
jgi:hypothetical protein